MASDKSQKPDQNDVKTSQSKEIRLTAKAYAEQHGISGRDVVEIVSRFGIEARRDEDGVVTYALDDLNHFMTQNANETNRRQRETELEFFRRLLPEIKASITESVREVCKHELTLAVAIRDTKESMLVELLGAQRAQVREIRATIGFLTRLVSQVNLATVAGAFGNLPTAGVSGSSISLGVDEPLPSGIGFPSQSGNTNNKSVSRPARTESETKLKSKAQNKDPISSSLATAQFRDHSHRAASGTDNSLTGEKNSDRSPLFLAMLPQIETLDPTYAEPIIKHQLLIEEILQMSDVDLTRINTDEKAAIEDILTPWSEFVADLPRFATFFGSFSTIQAWIAEKRHEMPLIIAFLALNRQVPGCVSASDFVDMFGVDAG